MLKTAKQNMCESASSPMHDELAEQKFDLPLVLLNAMKIESDSNRIMMKTYLTQQQEQQLLRPLIPVIAATRTAARRVDSANRVRQLMLGLLNYESAHGHFPPPVLLSDAGKKYSWRIAILPFIEEQALYQSYQFDEDWNSEHNRKVTAQVPAAFQHPLAFAKGSKFCSYFVITGKGTVFPGGDEKIGFDQLSDGSSNTFGVVEAKKDVHWAEPRDINFENGKLDTKTGGFTPGGFNASFCEGSTRFWSEKIDDKQLQLVIERADGKAFNWNQFQHLMKR